MPASTFRYPGRLHSKNSGHEGTDSGEALYQMQLAYLAGSVLRRYQPLHVCPP